MKVKYNDYARGPSPEILAEAHHLKEVAARLRPILDIRSADRYAAFVSGEALGELHDRIMDAFPSLQREQRDYFSGQVSLLLDNVSLIHGEKFTACKAAAQQRGREILPPRDRDSLKGELRSAMREVVDHIAVLHDSVQECIPRDGGPALHYTRH